MQDSRLISGCESYLHTYQSTADVRSNFQPIEFSHPHVLRISLGIHPQFSMVVSKQSATKAGEKTNSFLAPFLAHSSTTLSENGSNHFLSKRD